MTDQTSDSTEKTRLPRGKHGLSAHEVVQNQRTRLIWGMIGAVAEKGYVNTTVADVLTRSGVSRKTYYDMFDDKEQCFLEAYDVLVGILTGRVGVAYAADGDWAARVCRGLRALLDTFVERPEETRVAFVEGLHAGPAAFNRYDAAMQYFVPLLDGGRNESAFGAELPPRLSEVVVGGIAHMLYRYIAANQIDELVKIYDQLLYFALAPYLGHKKAARIVATESGS